MNTPISPHPAPGKASQVSMLCVEDDRLSREFLGKMLSIKFPAATIYMAENGRAGLELFRETWADMVLTDISMPIMDGIQMAREIRLLNPEAYIIAISAHSALDRELDDFSSLFNRYIMKPINSKQLCETIDETIAGITRERQEKK